MIIGNPKHVLKEIAHQIKGVISKTARAGVSASAINVPV